MRFKGKKGHNNPGPGEYNLQNAFWNQIEQKLTKGYRGNFGTTTKRFKQGEIEEEEDVGPGTYEQNIKITAGQKQKRSHYFKSKTKRKAFRKKKGTLSIIYLAQSFLAKVPPVGHYNPDMFTIAENTKQEQEDDPDLKIQKPGFNIG